MSGNPLDDNTIAALLAGGRGEKTDITKIRDVTTWFKLNHYRREEGCANPDCKDTRPKTDAGREIVAEVRGQLICRYCFLDGWLKDI
jgi:hypothetical protein